MIEIKLIGPGGAGKTTAGQVVAKRLDIKFFDLDECFIDESGDIDNWIATRGYNAYAHQNVENYLKFAPRADSVCALSSGFMTYPQIVHPDYEHIRYSISRHPQTFTLLPSLDKERCVVEIVRRQLARSIPTESPGTRREENPQAIRYVSIAWHLGSRNE